jgi:hypothetical protein
LFMARRWFFKSWPWVPLVVTGKAEAGIGFTDGL